MTLNDLRNDYFLNPINEYDLFVDSLINIQKKRIYIIIRSYN